MSRVDGQGALVAGLSGSKRHASAAVCSPERVLGVCPQERITRVRAAGANCSGLPDESLGAVLARAGRAREDVGVYALAEPWPGAPAGPVMRYEHHHAHACSAFLTSPFDAATVVVCDHEAPHLSVWQGHANSLTRVEWPWQGAGLAEIYSDCTAALGFTPFAEQRMEALARLEPEEQAGWAESLFSLDEVGLRVDADWRSRVETRVGGVPVHERAKAAAALQARLCDLLVELLGRIRRRVSAPRLCVGGSLFYNSRFNSVVKQCGVFDEVFVPIDPGNAGLSVGVALSAAGAPRRPVPPFLGPSYDADEIKATLDNCKLTYEWASNGQATARAVEALLKGQLVAWFDGCMEWGPRALGARSILASPFAPYVLDNLNRFLKHRDPWRGYALSAPERAVREHFDGPDTSPFMECDYTPKDRCAFRHVLPGPRAAVRVQTAGAGAPAHFQALLEAFGAAAGRAVLVNTSFNGFLEPIVCSPRDAIRVFFGTGIDMLVLGQFVVIK